MAAVRMLCSLFTIGLILAAAPHPAGAQFTKLIKERVKQKVEDRKRQTEENMVSRATEPADSALERIMSPVDSAAGKVGSKAGAAVGRAGRGPDPVAEQEALLRDQLAGNRADLAGVAFVPGTDALDPVSEPTITALARVLTETDGMFLLQGRADPGAADAQALAELRAVALKNWLMDLGIPGERIFAAGDGVLTQGGAVASVVRVQ